MKKPLGQKIPALWAMGKIGQPSACANTAPPLENRLFWPTGTRVPSGKTITQRFCCIFFLPSSINFSRAPAPFRWMGIGSINFKPQPKTGIDNNSFFKIQV